MHRSRNKFLLLVPTVLAALAALGLHRYMMEACIDDMGLLIPGNLPGKLLWALAIGFAGYLLILISTLGGDGRYEDDFPRSILSGGVLMAAGVVLLLNARSLGALPGVAMPAYTRALTRIMVLSVDWIMVALPWLAGAAMVVLGVYRMMGRKPLFVFSAIVCLLHMLTLIRNYRLWGADPQLHEYCFALLALVLLMLCSFHRTCCDAGVIQRKKLIFTCLTAAVCSAAAMSGHSQPGFFLASALWALGCVCDGAVLPPDPEEEENVQEQEKNAEE